MNAFDYRVSSGYGPRNIGGKFHHGVDYACPIGTDVLAPCDFDVIESRQTSAAGYELIGLRRIDNEDFYLHFIHLKTLPLGSVRNVKKGSYVATSGQSGTGAVGAHLHFEVNRQRHGLGYGVSNTVGSISPDEFFKKIENRKHKGDKKMHVGKFVNKTKRVFDDGDGDIVRYYVIQTGEKTTVRHINEPQAINLAWEFGVEIKEHGHMDDFYQAIWGLGAYNIVKNKDWENRHEIGHTLFDYPCGQEVRF